MYFFWVEKRRDTLLFIRCDEPQRAQPRLRCTEKGRCPTAPPPPIGQWPTGGRLLSQGANKALPRITQEARLIQARGTVRRSSPLCHCTGPAWAPRGTAMTTGGSAALGRNARGTRVRLRPPRARPESVGSVDGRAGGPWASKNARLMEGRHLNSWSSRQRTAPRTKLYGGGAAHARHWKYARRATSTRHMDATAEHDRKGARSWAMLARPIGKGHA